jgi:hypothetical protein
MIESGARQKGKFTYFLCAPYLILEGVTLKSGASWSKFEIRQRIAFLGVKRKRLGYCAQGKSLPIQRQSKALTGSAKWHPDDYWHPILPEWPTRGALWYAVTD